MNEFETLKLLKKMWEEFQDLCENSNCNISMSERRMIEEFLQAQFGATYEDIFNQNKDILEISTNFESKKVYIASEVYLDYVVKSNDNKVPNEYVTGGDINYHWWLED